MIVNVTCGGIHCCRPHPAPSGPICPHPLVIFLFSSVIWWSFSCTSSLQSPDDQSSASSVSDDAPLPALANSWLPLPMFLVVCGVNWHKSCFVSYNVRRRLRVRHNDPSPDARAFPFFNSKCVSLGICMVKNNLGWRISPKVFAVQNSGLMVFVLVQSSPAMNTIPSFKLMMYIHVTIFPYFEWTSNFFYYSNHPIVYNFP